MAEPLEGLRQGRARHGGKTLIASLPLLAAMALCASAPASGSWRDSPKAFDQAERHFYEFLDIQRGHYSDTPKDAKDCFRHLSFRKEFLHVLARYMLHPLASDTLTGAHMEKLRVLGIALARQNISALNQCLNLAEAEGIAPEDTVFCARDERLGCTVP